MSDANRPDAKDAAEGQRLDKPEGAPLRNGWTTGACAAAVTGTVTLELALAGVPMVTTYLGDRGQAKRFARYKVKFVALPNVILDRALVPEVLQGGHHERIARYRQHCRPRPRHRAGRDAHSRGGLCHPQPRRASRAT